jgi:hypothetical protein
MFHALKIRPLVAIANIANKSVMSIMSAPPLLPAPASIVPSGIGQFDFSCSARACFAKFVPELCILIGLE